MKSTLDKPPGKTSTLAAAVMPAPVYTPPPVEQLAPPGMPTQRKNILRREGLGKPPEPEFITFDDLCIRWRVDRTSVKYYVRRKILTPYHLTPGGKKIRFKLAEIKKLEADAGVAS
jgi:hypothetical protein